MAAAKSRFSRGISLIEAVVALAVMATGLLGIVGVQSTLRSNSDISKQRSEAVRLAQARIEELRLFANVTGAVPSFDGIVGSTETFVADPTRGVNATYTRTVQVVDMDTRAGVGVLDTIPRARSLRVTVSWQDRAGQAQAVTLNAAVAGTPPALAGTLAIPPDGDPTRLPLGRNRSIPPAAVNLGDGYSAYLPPTAASGVVWVFNNTSGIIQLCNLVAPAAGLTRSNIGSCASDVARLLSGFLRFNIAGSVIRPVALDTLSMTVLQTAPAAFANTVVACAMDITTAQPPTYTAFYCAVPVGSSNTPLPWSGSLLLQSSALFVQPGGPYRACRYFIPPPPPPLPPPFPYTDVVTNLVNQNFLIIDAAASCPLPPPNPLPNPLPYPQPLWTVPHQPP